MIHQAQESLPAWESQNWTPSRMRSGKFAIVSRGCIFDGNHQAIVQPSRHVVTSLVAQQEEVGHVG